MKLFPPIIDTFLPAFAISTVETEPTVCKIPFSISDYNNRNNIKMVQISILNQRTNKNVIKNNGSLFISMDNNKYNISLLDTYLQNNKFEIGEFYKIQLRFCDILPEGSSLSGEQVIVPDN